MSLMVRCRLTQVISQFPRTARRKQGKYPKENPGELQPQNARKLHERPPRRLAETFATLRQTCLRLSHLSCRSCSLLPQSNARRSRPALRWHCFGLYPGRGVWRGRRVHRRHQRLGCSASPESQRTSESNRIHTQSVASRHISMKTSHIEKHNGLLLHPTFIDGKCGEGEGGTKDEEFYLDGRWILCGGSGIAYLVSRPDPAYTGACSQSRSRLGRPSHSCLIKCISLDSMSLPLAEAGRILYRARQQCPQCRSPPLSLGREYPMRG